MKKSLLGLLFFSLMFGTAFAEVDADKLSKKKLTPQGKYLTAKDTYNMLQKDADDILFIDVRTRSEIAFVGMTPMVDANIPYMVSDVDGWNEKKSQFDMMPNSNFSVAFQDALEAKGLNKDSKVIVMCRSGSRSAKAANLLDQMGYKNVYTVVDGFEGDKAKTGAHKGQRVVNGWKNSDLPWSYKLAKGKMYFE